jgi:hypothetical protein
VRRPQRGAVSLLMALLASMLALAFGIAVFLGAARGAEEHAQSGADAVAHAVALRANALDRRDELSIEAQAGRWCTQGGEADPAAEADGELCTPLFDEAARIAAANDVELVTVVVGPDTRDLHAAPVPGRLAVLVVVAAAGPAAGSPQLCGRSDATPLCRPEAASAAELVW